MGKEIVGLKENCVQLQKALEKSEFKREELNAKQVSLISKRMTYSFCNRLQERDCKEQETLANVEEQCELLIKSKIQLEARVKMLSERVEEEEEINSELTARGRKLEDECSELRREIDDLETILLKSEKEKHATEHKVKNLSEEVESLKEIKTFYGVAEECRSLSAAPGQPAHRGGETQNLNNAKVKLGQSVDELEGALWQKRKAGMTCKRKKHKLEVNLKQNQASMEYLKNSWLQLTEKLRQ